MDNTILLDYLIWADTKILDIVRNLENDQLEDKDAQRYTKLIQAKLLHLLEEYRAWLCDIKGESYQDYIKNFQTMDINSLSKEILELHNEWKNYQAETNKFNFEIDEEDFVVEINLDEVIYNLVNHASYHRGQIVVLLRLMDIETPITDYYWFKIHQLNVM